VSKKEYQANEVAKAVLEKAQKVIKESGLYKNANNLEKADPQNQNAAQMQGFKGIKTSSAPKANEKPEMAMPKPQAAAKMPKPLKNFMNKMEMKKAQKGVHKPAFMSTGTSESGAFMSDLGNSKGVNNYAKEKHKEVLNDLKNMPKPNLPKEKK
jgi:hypothetical protein